MEFLFDFVVPGQTTDRLNEGFSKKGFSDRAKPELLSTPIRPSDQASPLGMLDRTASSWNCSAGYEPMSTSSRSLR
jgi:hypothetical protein